MPRRRLTTSPTSTPTRKPRKRPTVEPISAPETKPDRIVYEVYELIDFAEHRKCHPQYYGDQLGEFLTPALAKRWLRDHQRYGAFAIVERVNGKIGRAWPYEIDPPEDDGDYNPGGDPRVENAALKAENKILRNGAHNGYDPVTKAVMESVVPELIKPKSLADQLRDHQVVNSILHPRNENPAPQQTGDSSSVKDKILNSIIEHSEGAAKEKAIEMAFEWLKGEKAGQDIVMEVLQSPHTLPLAQTLVNGLLGIVDRVLPPRQAQAQEAPQEPAPTVQPTQQAQTPPQATPAQTQTMPETQQTQAQPEAMLSPEEQALALLLDHCRRNQPVKIAFDRLMAYADAINEQAPQYSIDGYIEMLAVTPTDQVIEFVKTLPNGNAVASLPHAQSWCAQLQQIIKGSDFFDESGEGEFDSIVELNHHKE
jgi:hypothetical protein